jgi:hypothetical protein
MYLATLQPSGCSGMASGVGSQIYSHNSRMVVSPVHRGLAPVHSGSTSLGMTGLAIETA